MLSWLASEAICHNRSLRKRRGAYAGLLFSAWKPALAADFCRRLAGSLLDIVSSWTLEANDEINSHSARLLCFLAL